MPVRCAVGRAGKRPYQPCKSLRGSPSNGRFSGLTGCKIAVTSLSGGSNIDLPSQNDAGATDGGSTTDRDLTSRVTALGATFSATVHKKLDALVASRTAMIARTQRVRKALKFGIPILKPEWIAACEKANAWVDVSEYVWPNRVERAPTGQGPEEGQDSDEPSSDEHGQLNRSGSPGEPGATPSWQPPEEWTSCYCSCHDDESAPPFCEWCIEGHPQIVAEVGVEMSGSAAGGLSGLISLKDKLEQFKTRQGRRLVGRVRDVARERFNWQCRVVPCDKNITV
eukprot:m.464516 g.464516  ORF g.464516 m.464516 type:complete len:282 (-) comp23548_c0_seq1:2929-3774(-)